MFNLIRNWYREKFSDPQAVTLTVILLVGFAVIYFYGKLIMPLLVAVVFAYMLESPVSWMTRKGLPRSVSASLVLVLFAGAMLVATLGLLPALWRQGVALATELPAMVSQWQQLIMTLPEKYPTLIDEVQLASMMANFNHSLLSTGQNLVSQSLSSLVDLVALMVYAILVPLLMFFFLKDKEELLASFGRFIPDNRDLAKQVWGEMNIQIGNYIRGKVIEILIIGTTSYLTFFFMDLRYAALLGALVGLSVLIPYIGATVVTVPVALVGFFQWGISPEFGYLMLAYGIIQAIDGNVLVPLLFSEAVNLHPVAIIVAVLIFGGLWGFWGVFFAIPLATLVKAVVNAWPTHTPEPENA
ncbi:AI-2E family transporter [Ferrimonas balearica]|uniref:AI-2E family transporter n=1 Tax=Ferrimonas balearica TaxID=44012 RepID=UPI001C9A1798|nr:AI-2E family transporter [Ferrimonas balearica]MBY5921070.1 AI-2E family transporter [Ferrimonas balearica]MBY5996245.1 AI-2E family transporter [Ferrimonas balearica]